MRARKSRPIRVEAATLDAVRVGALTTVWVGCSETDGAVLMPSVVKTEIREGKG